MKKMKMKKTNSNFSKWYVASAFALVFGVSAQLASQQACADDELEKRNYSRLSVVGIADFYTPSVDHSNASLSDQTNSSRLGTGLGILSESSTRSPLNVEYGLLMIHRSNSYESSLFNYTQSSNWLTLPVSLKWRIGDLFAIGAGPYLAYRVGDVSNNFSSGSSSLLSFDTTQQEKFELGLQASAGVTLPVTDNLGILIEARLLRGFSNLSKDTHSDIKSLDVIGLAGVQFNY